MTGANYPVGRLIGRDSRLQAPLDVGEPVRGRYGRAGVPVVVALLLHGCSRGGGVLGVGVKPGAELADP